MTTTETITTLPDCIITQLRDEAAEHGDEKTVADCNLILAGDVGDDEYDAAMARCVRTIEQAAAMADDR